MEIATVCSVALIAVGCDGRGAARPAPPRSDIAGQSSFPLISTESILNLGEVPKGGRKHCDFWLTNRKDSPVEVDKIETSCDCLTIDLAKKAVAPGQKVAGRTVLDLRHEPRFTGNLGIGVKGKDKSGRFVFELEVRVAVVKE